MRYQEIREAFLPPVKWRWVSRSKIEHVAIFKIGKVTYTVSLFRYDSAIDAWELSFVAATRTKDYGFRVSGTGHARTVFGTVVAITRDFITNRHPHVIKIENDITERSRLAINRRITDAIISGNAYDMESDYATIWMTRKD